MNRYANIVRSREGVGGVRGSPQGRKRFHGYYSSFVIIVAVFETVGVRAFTTPTIDPLSRKHLHLYGYIATGLRTTLDLEFGKQINKGDGTNGLGCK